MEIHSHNHNKRIINYKLEWYFFQYTVRYFTITFGRQILKLSEWDGKVYWFKSWNTDRYSMSKTCGRNNYIWYHSHSKKATRPYFTKLWRKREWLRTFFAILLSFTFLTRNLFVVLSWQLVFALFYVLMHVNKFLFPSSFSLYCSIMNNATFLFVFIFFA